MLGYLSWEEYNVVKNNILSCRPIYVPNYNKYRNIIRIDLRLKPKFFM
jgi:uncharacterized protein (UPF0297 family)